MALAWPDVSSATITDAAVLRSLANAMRERQAAAAALGGQFVGEFPIFYDVHHVTPALYRLRQIREYIRALAPQFVRIDDDSYASDTSNECPHAYTDEDLFRGEHSLASLPAPGTPEGCEAALTVYRSFIENCIWWLGRFRYVDVSSLAYCTRRCRAYAERIQYEDFVRPAYSYDTGTDPSDAMENPDISAMTRAGALRIECLHEFRDVTYPAVSHEIRNCVSATAWSGLVVRNASGLEADLKLVPCRLRASQTIYVFDGFGYGSLGVPVPAGTVSAYGSTVAVQESGHVPFPDVWDLSQRLDPYGEATYECGLRLVPILDFDSSYQYRASA